MSLVTEVKAKQDMDSRMVKFKKLVSDKKIEVFCQGRDGILHYQGQLCIPNVDVLRE